MDSGRKKSQSTPSMLKTLFSSSKKNKSFSIERKESIDEQAEAPDKRATIGIRCADSTVGSDFYRSVQQLMAILFPREYDRPKIYADLGGDNENNSALLGHHRKTLDLILVPKAKTSDDKKEVKETKNNGAYLQELFKAINPGVDISKEHLALFAKYDVQVVDKSKFTNKIDIEKNSSVIGIVGGMGPEADGYTLQRVALNARESLSKLRVYLVSDPRVPRKASQYLNVSKLQTYKKRLQNFLKIPELGSIIVPSNTFHTGLQFSWAQSLANNKILSIIDAVSLEVKEKFKGKRIGLLATSTTAKSGIYTKSLSDMAIIQPDEKLQGDVDLGIKAMKTGDMDTARKYFISVIDNLKEKGADVVLLGCTEIPLALEGMKLSVEHVDSADILARAVVNQSIDYRMSADPLIACVDNSLLEYYKANQVKKLHQKLHDRDPGLAKELAAAKQTASQRNDLAGLKDLVDKITSGEAYSAFHRNHPYGLDSILRKNMKELGLDCKTEITKIAAPGITPGGRF